LAAFIVLLWLIRPVDYSDTFNYAKHIADQHNQHVMTGRNPFFDFGHVLWRPLGWLVWSPLRTPLGAMFHGDDILGAGLALIALSVAGGFLGAVLLYLWIARSTGSAWAAAMATIAYSGTNALLHYTPTGMAYVAGIACQIAALTVLQYFLSRDRFTMSSGALAGLLLGLSVAIWFPHVLTAGGVLCYAVLAEGTVDRNLMRRRAAGIAGLVAGTAAMLAIVYGVVIVMAHLTTMDAISQWISASRYGKKPDRGLLRLLGGIPRGFFSLGEGGVAWKRMLFEGRTLSPVALIQTGIWKVALVYFVFASAAMALWRSSWGRRLLVSFLALAIPLFIFALLFEADPPERYMAAFPLLFLAFGGILADRRSATFPRALLGIFFLAMLAVNLDAMWRFRSDAGMEAARIRVEALNQRVLPQDRIILLS